MKRSIDNPVLHETTYNLFCLFWCLRGQPPSHSHNTMSQQHQHKSPISLRHPLHFKCTSHPIQQLIKLFCSFQLFFLHGWKMLFLQHFFCSRIEFSMIFPIWKVIAMLLLVIKYVRNPRPRGRVKLFYSRYFFLHLASHLKPRRVSLSGDVFYLLNLLTHFSSSPTHSHTNE